MPFKPGQSGNPKGKPKGPNKATVEFRQTVQALLDDNKENVSQWLDDVAKQDPGRALSLLKDLAEFAAPKLARTEHTGANGEAIKQHWTVEMVRAKSPTP